MTPGPGSTAQGQQTQGAQCALLYSAVPHSFGHEFYSPKEAMKTISLSRQTGLPHTAFYPLMEKEKSAGDLSGLLHLITGTGKFCKFSTAIDSPI